MATLILLFKIIFIFLTPILLSSTTVLSKTAAVEVYAILRSFFFKLNGILYVCFFLEDFLDSIKPYNSSFVIYSVGFVMFFTSCRDHQLLNTDNLMIPHIWSWIMR